MRRGIAVDMFSGIDLVGDAIAEDARVGVGWHGGGVNGEPSSIFLNDSYLLLLTLLWYLRRTIYVPLLSASTARMQLRCSAEPPGQTTSPS